MVSEPESSKELSLAELLEIQKQRLDKERAALHETFRNQMIEAIRLLHPEKPPLTITQKWCVDWLVGKLHERFPNHVVPENQQSPWPVRNWFLAKNIPEMPILIAVSDILHQSIDWLLGQPTSFPQMVISRTHYDNRRAECLGSAHSEVLIQLTTGTTFPADGIGLPKLKEAILRSREEKRSFKLCILVTSKEDNISIEMISRRRDTGGSRTTIQDTIKATIGSFIDVAVKAKLIDFEKPKTLSNLEIIQVPFVAPITNIIADPYDHDRGRMVILQPNFQRTVYDAPMVEYFKAKHQTLFEWYVQDFKRMKDWAMQSSIEGIDRHLHGPLDLAKFH